MILVIVLNYVAYVSYLLYDIALSPDHGYPLQQVRAFLVAAIPYLLQDYRQAKANRLSGSLIDQRLASSGQKKFAQ